jgi:N-acetylated-alpha-linked acidic dipeptidase
MITAIPVDGSTVGSWRDVEWEQKLLDDISLDLPWPVIEQFSTIVRLSGTPDERRAVELIAGHLARLGIAHTIHEPVCFISHPLEGTIRAIGGRTYGAKTSAMSVSTGGAEFEGELVYIPGATGSAGGVSSVVSATVDLGNVDVAGKIVITEGMPFPGKVTAVAAAGAIAGVFVGPGQRIHETICTNIWGTPDLDNAGRQPAIPVIAVNNADGLELIDAAKRGGRVALSTRLDTGWRPIPVLVAEIPGASVPDEFVLLHGHLDSWHEGVGDNATGDAAMLELARVFARARPARSLRVAWWSGHSHGRYAGSTWYADQFGVDLARDCVAQVNCDSPGCRWAETFNELTCMSEAEQLVHAAVGQIAGIEPETKRPPRAGDYSFNGIGITSFYMLSSTMSEELRAEKGYYAVGGCGGNIAWHTEDDTMEIADRDHLLRDLRVYAGTIARVLNAPALPFDWRQTTAEFRATLATYSAAAAGACDFSPARRALDELDAALLRFYSAAPTDSPGSPAARRFNHAQRRLARLLIPVNFSRMAPFWHDPALNVGPLPDLAPALTIPAVTGDPGELGIRRAHLTRGQNRLVWALLQARETVERAMN